MQHFSDSEYFIPFIKLVGYGRQQTYQLVCCRCKDLFFNLDTKRDLEDLFCDSCTASREWLNHQNISNINYLGIVIGWEVKSASLEKKRSFYNYRKVYKRDRYQCQFCGYSPYICNDFRPLHVDHLKPWSAGGSNRMDNMVVSCSKCNQHASNKWFNSFYEKKMYVNKLNPEIPNAFTLIDQKWEDEQKRLELQKQQKLLEIGE